jgi:hypothetical protein
VADIVYGKSQLGKGSHCEDMCTRYIHNVHKVPDAGPIWSGIIVAINLERPPRAHGYFKKSRKKMRFRPMVFP